MSAIPAQAWEEVETLADDSELVKFGIYEELEMRWGGGKLHRFLFLEKPGV